MGESELRLNSKLYFELSWNAVQADNLQRKSPRTICAPLKSTGKRGLSTARFRRLFQEDRRFAPALTLKLHCFEDTGAILAALTTSSAGGIRRPEKLGLPVLLAPGRILRPLRAERNRPF